MKLSTRHSQMHTPQVQKEEVKTCIQGRSSMHHAVKLFQSYIATAKTELCAVDSPSLASYFLHKKCWKFSPDWLT